MSAAIENYVLCRELSSKANNSDPKGVILQLSKFVELQSMGLQSRTQLRD